MSNRAALLVALGKEQNGIEARNKTAESPLRSSSSVPGWFLQHAENRPPSMMTARAKPKPDDVKRQLFEEQTTPDETTSETSTRANRKLVQNPKRCLKEANLSINGTEPKRQKLCPAQISRRTLLFEHSSCQGSNLDKDLSADVSPQETDANETLADFLPLVTAPDQENNGVGPKKQSQGLHLDNDLSADVSPQENDANETLADLLPLVTAPDQENNGVGPKKQSQGLHLDNDLSADVSPKGSDANVTLTDTTPEQEMNRVVQLRSSEGSNLEDSTLETLPRGTGANLMLTSTPKDQEMERSNLEKSLSGFSNSVSSETTNPTLKEAVSEDTVIKIVAITMEATQSFDPDHTTTAERLEQDTSEDHESLVEQNSFFVHDDHIASFDSIFNSSSEVTLEVEPVNDIDEETQQALDGSVHEVDEETERAPEVTLEDQSNEAENIDNNNNNGVTKSRKRTANPDMWKTNIAKRLKNSGQAYVDKKGREKEAVAMKGPCACKMMCKNKINNDERAAVFTSFWNLGDHRRQWEFITNNVFQSKVSRKTVGEEAPSRRQNSRQYHLYRGEGKLREKILVCKTMFLNTLSIGGSWIESAFSHLLSGNSFTVSPDKRGKHDNRPNKTTDAQKETIRNHINSYPRMPSHYCRARTSREYLESALNVAKMHRHYLEWFTQKNLPEANKASKRAYEEVFNTEFNLGFFIPKKDQCSLCNLVKFGTRAEREKFKEKYATHIVCKKQAQNVKSAAKKMAVSDPEKTACLVFDFQKILQCPKSDTSTFYYLSKLSAFNFTVYNMGKQDGLCYMWHEVTAKKGSDEVASMLFYHFENLAKEGITTVLAFSDSCWSQNKNRYVFSMMLLAAAKFKIRIQLCFLEPGHTHNEGDSVHALIEKSTKDKHIFDFSEWMQAVRTAKVNEPMYTVKEVTQNMVYDFHTLVDGLTNWEKDTEKKKIMWSKVKIVEASPQHIGILKFQYDFNGPTCLLDIKQRRGHPVNLLTYKPPQKYKGKIPLKALKIKHLKELCKSLAIPSKYHHFYESIFNQAEPVENDEVADPQADEDCAEPSDEDLDRYIEVDRRKKNNEDQEAEDEAEEDDQGEDDPGYMGDD